MTAATALMDFPFSFQQEISRKPIIHHTEMLTRMLLGIMLPKIMCILLMLSNVMLFLYRSCLLKIKDS